MDAHAGRVPGMVQELESRSDRIRELQSEVTQLRHAVTAHALIDQAIGVLVAVGRITPEEAWDALRETSMCTNTKLRKVAELVVEWAQNECLPADIRDELAPRLQSHTPE
ncbi:MULTISPECIES: ANTAR domain-containing protein [unclassified Streptomyces]|uniref:ANTAR domain-containing protein n=1 Tax=unclassified Streptomyces TaxID=2593676 RepID=UPI0033B3A816